MRLWRQQKNIVEKKKAHLRVRLLFYDMTSQSPTNRAYLYKPCLGGPWRQWKTTAVKCLRMLQHGYRAACTVDILTKITKKNKKMQFYCGFFIKNVLGLLLGKCLTDLL